MTFYGLDRHGVLVVTVATAMTEPGISTPKPARLTIAA
jgi:hypothetical protein